ncbi:MAG: SCP2 sterol-binding domain-containing protein [Candidatus Actinomarina sp.]|nr:SCP2 sterol-binding domain-containing protein [Candidatus Actinomarina sp.]MDA2946756.1 SCP2 sterol-binding domain-containing protein [Actinomycetota bacterium]MBL6762863.1 SCP2 sterol-binding domain-containing protein [Candidatus Actinomarina sp.]MBL6835680.1 SCP2 sterol-binding domain-containing protein [Candidatus Actinomarina sp.]MDA3008304.1 SCP2 sterol-binding domain-containing protein [Actinomycetota bacterium]
MIEDILKQFKSNLTDKNIDLSSIYFEITDIDKTFNLDSCVQINSSIEDKRFLKFKISTENLLLIVEGKKHPEDLLFNEKVKISGDISILAP